MTTVSSQLLCLPRNALNGVCGGKKSGTLSSWRWLTKGIASASMATAIRTRVITIVEVEELVCCTKVWRGVIFKAGTFGGVK